MWLVLVFHALGHQLLDVGAYLVKDENPASQYMTFYHMIWSLAHVLYSRLVVLFCSAISSWVLSATKASKCFEYFSIYCLMIVWMNFCLQHVHIIEHPYSCTIIIILSTGLSLLGLIRYRFFFMISNVGLVWGRKLQHLEIN